MKDKKKDHMAKHLKKLKNLPLPNMFCFFSDENNYNQNQTVNS